jgi:hypothetical protein
MAIVKNLLGSGIAGGAAQSITGRASLAQAATGASQGAQIVVNDIVEFTTSTTNYGPTLSASAASGDTYTIVNNSVNTIGVFPPTGGKINNGSANAANSQPTLTTSTYTSLGNGNYVVSGNTTGTFTGNVTGNLTGNVTGNVTGTITTGTSGTPIAKTAAGNINTLYGTTSATTGDTRASYNKLTFTSTGSGETLRTFSEVTGVGGATAGTINGEHVTLSINGSGTISGAGNALRATLGGTSTNPGGTLAAIQADSNFATGGTWTNASFIRFTNSGTGTVANLFNVPAALVVAQVSADSTHTIKIVDSAGTAYYLMATTVAP